MVYLLHKYFGRDGREEADDLLRAAPATPTTPRMLGAFNEATPDWLSFFMFTFFTDRDGKMQLEALAQSGFDPLSRTCRFMLTEEAHHMFVGETGVGRVIQRTCEAMREAGIEDPYDIDRVRALGVIDLPTIQKKANLHFSLSLDLFGSEISTNAANAFNAGIKGRTARASSTTTTGCSTPPTRCCASATAASARRGAGADRHQRAPARRLRARLRRRHRALEQGDRQGSGVAFEFKLPHVAFNRRIGEFAAANAAPDGTLISEAEWQAGKAQWLPSPEDGDFIESLMRPEYTPPAAGFAGWIAPPRRRRRQQAQAAIVFEYVKIEISCSRLQFRREPVIERPVQAVDLAAPVILAGEPRIGVANDREPVVVEASWNQAFVHAGMHVLWRRGEILRLLPGPQRLDRTGFEQSRLDRRSSGFGIWTNNTIRPPYLYSPNVHPPVKARSTAPAVFNSPLLRPMARDRFPNSQSRPRAAGSRLKAGAKWSSEPYRLIQGGHKAALTLAHVSVRRHRAGSYPQLTACRVTFVAFRASSRKNSRPGVLGPGRLLLRCCCEKGFVLSLAGLAATYSPGP
jgi:hypothetical protein